MKVKINVDLYVDINYEEEKEDAIEQIEQFISQTNQDNEITNESVTIDRVSDYSITK